MFTVVEHLRPYALMLVGLPGTGKSTFVAQLPKDFKILSTDDIVERFAAKQNMDYTTAFNAMGFGDIEDEFYEEFYEAVVDRKDIVIDQTNVSAKTRRKKLLRVPEGYHKVAVVFQLPEDELQRRLDLRSKTTGKTIPPHIMADMLRRWELPTKAEGFDDIVYFTE